MVHGVYRLLLRVTGRPHHLNQPPWVLQQPLRVTQWTFEGSALIGISKRVCVCVCVAFLASASEPKAVASETFP